MNEQEPRINLPFGGHDGFRFPRPSAEDTAEELAHQEQREQQLEDLVATIELQRPEIARLYDDAIRIIDENVHPEEIPGTFELEDDSEWANERLRAIAETVVGRARCLSPEAFQTLSAKDKDVIVFCERYAAMQWLLNGSTGGSDRLNAVLGDDEKQAATDDLRGALLAVYPELEGMPFLDHTESGEDYIYARNDYLDENLDPSKQRQWRERYPIYKLIRPYIEKYAARTKS